MKKYPSITLNVSGLNAPIKRYRVAAIKKWAKDFDRYFSKEDYRGPETSEKILSITSYQRGAN